MVTIRSLNSLVVVWFALLLSISSNLWAIYVLRGRQGACESVQAIDDSHFSMSLFSVLRWTRLDQCSKAM